MAEYLRKLHDSLAVESRPDLFLRSLRSDRSLKLGLHHFYLILSRAVSVSVSDDDGRGENQFGFDSLSDSQVRSVLSLGLALVSSARSFSVEQVESEVAAVAHRLLEFTVSYLEKSRSRGDNLGIKNDVVLLMELCLLDEAVKVSEPMQSSVDSLLQLLPVLSIDSGGIQLDNHITCGPQGFSCNRRDKPVELLLATVSSKSFQHEMQGPVLTGPPQDMNNLVFLCQHWAVLHLDCIRRLMLFCRELIELPESFYEKVDSTDLCQQLSFGVRILKLLQNLARGIAFVEYNGSLLQAVALFADRLPCLFRARFEFLNSHAVAEGSLESLIMLLLEEFLRAVRLIFCNSYLAQNTQVCVLASILGNLDLASWRYDKSDGNPRPLLVCFPQTVLCIFRLIQDIKGQSLTELNTDQNLSSNFSDDDLSCLVNSRKIFLLQKFSVEELLEVIFDPSIQWMDNLMHLISFLHHEGVKLRPKIERSYSSASKANVFSEVETAIAHEDEALFGNLFSEGRSVGSVDGYDQLAVCVNSSLSTCNMPMQAAAEILSFLKECVFSREWPSHLFEDGCRKLQEMHLEMLLSILQCKGCSSEEKPSDGCVSSLDGRKIEHVHELCFGLLVNLVTTNALSDSLEQFLVEQILDDKNDAFIYNDQTLTLLAHAILSRLGTAGSQLRLKLYQGFLHFIVGKAKAVCANCPKPTELLGMLPSIFHIEILLMAFHLSSDVEKATLAKLIFSSLQEIDVLPTAFGTTELSCWALLVSRLILLMRHMILYSHTYPSSLLLDMQLRLREARISRSVFSNGFAKDHFISWASVAAKHILGSCVKEEPFLNTLLKHLIEVSALSPPLCKDKLPVEFLGLSWIDLCTTFSHILDNWRGKRAAAMEDLIVERYIFSLCSDIPLIVPTSGQKLRWASEAQALDLCNMLYFFHFSYSIIGLHDDMADDMDILDAVIGVLQRVHAVDVPDDFGEIGWDFLRSRMWLSLVLSFFNVGIYRYCIKTNVPGPTQSWTEDPAQDCQFLTVAEHLVSRFIQAGKSSMLLRILSALLDRCLKVYRKAFSLTFDYGQCGADGFSSLLLLKHSSYDKSLHSELIKETGSGSYPLEPVYDLLPKLDGTVEERALGCQCKMFWQSMLHGFPSHPQTPSAILLSCILSVKEIIFLLHSLFTLENFRDSISTEIEALRQVLDSMMTIKFDRVFASLEAKCEAIVRNLSVDLDLVVYTDLFQLKHMEGLLREMNVSGVSDSNILQLVVLNIVDSLDRLKKDPIRSHILRLYLGSDFPKPAEEIYELQHGDLLVLIDSLDNCCSELVNEKVLGFFVDLLSGESCPNLKQKLQKKFFGMDLLNLSKWFEQRLLGCISESSGVANVAEASSASLREITMSFISSLLSPPSDTDLEELHNHLFEAVVALLETAFLHFDVHIAKCYFHYVVQLSSGQNLIPLLIERTIILMEKLAVIERLLPGLKFLFNFLHAVLSESGSGKNTLEKAALKSCGRGRGVASASLKQIGSRKDSETLVVSRSQEGGASPLECEATSGDEDEDDGTSDGDVASIDKDDDDTNSERALASKVCTFTSSGSNFMEQHWYFCYTCDLTVSKGCCSVCAKVCHNGHRVVYSRSSRFFCDCGAGGVRGSSCQCLKPRKYTGHDGTPASSTSNYQSLLPFPEDRDQLPETDSDLDEDVTLDSDASLGLSIPRVLQDGIPLLLQKLEAEGRVIQLLSSLFSCITSKREANLSKDKKVILGKDKFLTYGLELLQLKKSYKSGSLDLKIKADYANAKELRSHLASGSLMKSLLSVSNRGRLAVGEGDKVSIFDVGQLIGQATVAPVTADKANIKPLSRNIVRFEIVHLAFNTLVENYLAVAGYDDCQVLTLNTRGEVTDRLAIELALQGAYIRRIDWVPGSQVKLMVVSNRFIKIYDLSLDNISPLHYITLPDDMIVDATLFMASQGRMYLLVLSEKGSLFRLELSAGGNVGATPLKEFVEIRDRENQAKGLSLYFSPTYKLLVLSYQDGTTLMGRLSSDARSLSEVSFIYEDEQGGKTRPAGLHHWKELLAGSGLFACMSSLKLNAALAVSMGAHELHAQSMRHTANSTSHLVGLTAYKPLSKDKIHCLVLHDDGSLQIYWHIPEDSDTVANVTAEKVKKLGSGILNSKAYAGIKPEFPLDFFEKTVCITQDVKLSGDAIRNGDSESAKQSLSSEDGFLESPSPVGFKVIVSNSNPDIVMVGFRVHVGHTSASHIPSEITIFQRVIKLDEGMRSWYDIPLTVAESLLADEEIVITIGPTFNGTMLSRIDALEVYGRAKDEFGWKEKMDAVLDMEAHVLGSNPLLAGSGRKFRAVQPAQIQEQVLVDGLKLLARLYSLSRSQEDMKVELSDLNCRPILEAIFESDREPLLQAAACHVLQAVFPKREKYYQVKDTIRLQGVVKSTSALSSRLGVGGSTGAWIIEEFTAQMRAVSKIALHRRPNLAFFLEANGSEVVDGLMEVLWGILDLEQPDTQTMNNIVVSSVELIYCYAECLALHGSDASGHSVAPAVALLKKLLFSLSEAVQTSSSLAISSRLLQVPFPKQTLLTTDDSIDAAVSSSGPAESAGGNAQVMIEEDAITSSVQYCCDGCSTVPILRCRWHCTVCPDFDLCEACYQVLDADRLPPPHSREHPMTAIPIEMESLGGDGGEIQFSPDDANDSSLLPIASDARSQNAAPIHVLESNDSGDFSASVTDAVSISASKRAVNSLLLSELLEQMKGWMETTSGTRAIPILQLFYRLSSAVGGPFIDSSISETLGLEKLIRWFLDEIDLSKPFVAKTRSSFGEVAILIFMFFTLMLRNWHHPGSDGSTSKSSGSVEMQSKNVFQVTSAASLSGQEKDDLAAQLVRACSTLRNQAFVNYLMDILQQLVNVFKSPTSCEAMHGLNAGSGCGALLMVRRDLPAGNYSPFFSDSYAKAHRADIFVDYHRLLLENAFRLVYTLVRPEKQDKTGEKERVYKISSGKDLKLDGYQDVLCSYINNPQTTFVRRYARRLFLHLCGSKTHYYSVRDSWQFSSEVKKLYKHINKAGGLQSPAPYERSVKIVKCLSTMAEVATARPRNWQKYCLRHGDILPFLMNAVFYFGEESVIQTLKLLNLAFYSGKDMIHSSQKAEGGDSATSLSKSGSHSSESKKKKKGEDNNESGSEKSYLDMESVVDIFTSKAVDVLRQFIVCFLLEWSSSSVRVEAKSVLYGAWHHGKSSFKETMLASLLQKVKSLPMYGQNIVEFTELITCLLEKVPDNGSKEQSTELVDRCLSPDVVRSIFDTLHSQNELIANHPNSRIYNTLSSVVEFDGYYLESEPCVACSSPEVPYTRMKLESLKSETKFTDNRIIVKCAGSYTIQSVTMNVHDARKSKSVKVLNLYYNNRPVADLSELKNNWSLWKRAKSCHLAFNQIELKVDFPIPITACNFMIELDSFYENLQALSLEPLQCPRCSRPVTDKHGLCSNCHENAYQCRQCRNINYENLDSFLCNECGYSKYGRFEFNFMAKPSFTFDNMENDEDMKRGLAAIESESENAHRRYQQLLGFKKPLLKIVSTIGENEMDSQQKDSVQQMMVSLPGPSCKINRKIALLGALYGEKCKATFDSVSKSVQTLQGLRRVLMSYLHQKHSDETTAASRFVVSRSPNNCYGCAITFVSQCLEMLQVLSKHASSKRQLVAAGILSELFENNIHQGSKTARVQARAVLCAFSEGDVNAVTELNTLIQKKVMYCLEHYRSMDIAVATREELLLLSEICSLADEFWESRLRVVFQLMFSSIKLGAKHPAIAEHIILPCLRIISQACTPPKPDSVEKEQGVVKSAPVVLQKDENKSASSTSLSGLASGGKSVAEASEKNWDASHKTQDIQLLSYSEWEKGASYLDFVRRQYKVSQAIRSAGQRSRLHKNEYLTLKYALRWKRRASKSVKGGLSMFDLGSWVTELVLSACSQSIRAEMCMLISLLCAQGSSRRFRLLNLLMALLPSTLATGESAGEYFELLFKMIDSEDARLFLTVRGCLTTICKLITQEVSNVQSLERSLHIDISQGFILHKLIELLGKFLEVPNIRSRFMRENLLSDILEALIVIRGLIVQKTKLINDCNRLLKDLLDGLLLESSENRRQFIRACICGLQIHGEERRGRTCLFILEQLCNLICPSKLESVYLLVLNKAHTQEEFIRGSMTKNPYSSAEIGPLMRDVKNKICHQLDLLGLLEDDYGMELLVAGNIISLDLSVAQVYEQVWKKSNNQVSNASANSALLSSSAIATKDYPPMSVTYRLQGLDGEATEPMIKELEEDREESQDPEVEFAIAGAVREYGGLEILLSMIQRLRDDFKSNQEQLVAVLNLLMHCCKIRENRRALLRLGALGLLLETARHAFSVDAMEPAEGILLIVESLTLEANESENISITQSALTVTNEETGMGEQAKKIVLMFLERLCHPSGLRKSNKQQRNTEMVARILPYLTYGEPAAMEALVQHFDPCLQNWKEFDQLQKQVEDNSKDDEIVQKAAKQRFTVENFVRVSESLKTSSCGERLKDIILERGITAFSVIHLQESFAVAGQAGFRSTAEWSMGLKLPSIPHILSMLRGLSMGHLATQKCIDEGGILPLLHALEGVPGENEIGARAENLLDTLSNKEGKGDGFLEEKVRKLRYATRDEMRRRALQKREELLQGLGMRQELTSDGGERIVVAQPVLEGFDDVEEEDGLACMVCREGYNLRPTDLLGVYSFSKRVNLGVGTSGSARGECVYTTVSYFNIIHFQCHQEAKRADAALKNPKKEWEGATLRNNESLCNSLFPIRGPSVPLPQYTRYVDQYWDNLNALGRADGSRLRLLTYDIVLMLARFATGASFSSESRGGGSESNSKFLPFMIQMAHHLLEQGTPSQRRSIAKAVASYITSAVPDSKPSTPTMQPVLGTEETVQFMMVNSLLSESYESWLQHRHGFLQRGIYHAYMQHTHGRSPVRASSSPTGMIRVESGSTSKSPSTETVNTDDLLVIVRPMLVYTGLIEQLQHFFKVKKSVSFVSSKAKGTSIGTEDENRGLEGWELVMKEKLLNVTEMIGLSKELLSWLDEMNSATDLQEAFDIIGVLADVLSGGITRCEDFVQAAIDAGKS